MATIGESSKGNKFGYRISHKSLRFSNERWGLSTMDMSEIENHSTRGM